VVVETISATNKKSGLKVQAVLDADTYKKNLKISDEEMKAFETRHLHRHESRGLELHRCERTRCHPRNGHARKHGSNFCVSPQWAVTCRSSSARGARRDQRVAVQPGQGDRVPASRASCGLAAA